VFGIQTVPAAIAGLPYFRQPLGFGVEMIMLAGLIVVLVSALLQRGVRIAMGSVAVLFLVIVVTWPLTALHPSVDEPTPWVWYLLSVATAYAATAFPIWLATIYTLAIPFAYGVIRTLPCGGGQSVEIATLDSTYAVILGGALLVIMAMLRQAASAVDTAQSAALARYATAVRQHATEVERVQVDAIVHDSVLTTLLSAADARTPEAQELAARMAADAIGHLHSAEAQGPESDAEVALDRLSDRISQAASAFSAPFAVQVHGLTARSLPVPVAEALYSASVQAMVNSMQHAGEAGVDRSLEIAADETASIVIRIADDGPGFDPQTVPVERLGLRVSIRERIAKVGGDAEVWSAPGAGTTITLRWPSASPPQPEVAEP
jgi:signal transduction histidine kinase